MKLLSLKSIFTFSHLASKRFFTSQKNFSSKSADLRLEKETCSIPVAVWWDFENCRLPSDDASAFRVSQRITVALRAIGIKGPVQITGVGDVTQIPRDKQVALHANGIKFSHIPTCANSKNSADRYLIMDVMYWVLKNPPPAHIFIISDDGDFARLMHGLRLKNYNVLLAGTNTAPSVLCSAATIMWQWYSLVKGESLRGKLFNQPPDGPYGSWYGKFKGPLEDPFAASQHLSLLPAEDSKSRPNPEPVVNYIRQILALHPEGIPMSHIRAEIKESDLTVDKGFYGCKKFSVFLSTLPDVLKLIPREHGQFFVVPASAEANMERCKTSKSKSKLKMFLLRIKNINARRKLRINDINARRLKLLLKNKLQKKLNDTKDAKSKP